MKVSVIVPVYNVEAYLARCLESLLSQTYNDFEIICINDCTPDGSDAVLAEYSQRYPMRIRVLNNERNLGLGLSRERGLEAASGEYVLFVDSDDYVKPDYIETLVDGLHGEKWDVVIGGYIRDANGKLIEHLPSDSIWSMVTYAIVCAKLWRRAFFIENNMHFTDVACGEDIYFSLAAFYCCARYKVIPYAGYYYYYNNQSITGTMTYEKNHERLMAELFDSFLSRHDLSVLSKDRRDVIEYVYIANMVNALAVFNRGCGIRRMREKLDFVSLDISQKFPNWLHNPYIGFFGQNGQTLRIRLGVSGAALLARLHMLRAFFYVLALV